MPIPITITLNSIVGTPGPFSLYSCIESTCSGSLTPFVTGVSLSNLQTGSFIPDISGSTPTHVKIKSTGAGCDYEISKPIVGLPTNTPTPTPTNTATPSPTPTPTPNCVTSVQFEVVSGGQVRYVDCCGNTEYANVGAGPEVINGCIQNGSLFSTSASITDISYGSTSCSCVITPTPTPINTTLNNVVSGTTLSEVCAGGATTPTLYFAGASIQIGESLYLNSNLTGPVPAGYYYYPDYNTVYNVTNGSTGAVASTPICPTATPISTFLGWNFGTQLVENGPLAITLVDDPTTACSNPEYVIGDGTSNTVTWNFTVYGSNITNATAIVLLSSGFRSELTLNAIFYVRQRISGTFYYRRFQLNGSPGDTNVTATPTDVSFSC
jgi:hypothetical protein